MIKKVLFLGPEGTYSHQAAIQQFSNGTNKVDFKLLPAKSIVECFNGLEDESNGIDYSIVPLENSTNGQVVFSYDLLRDRVLQCDTKKGNMAVPKLEIINEQYVSIDHCLLCSNTESGKTMNELFNNFSKVRIYSHPQVWGQIENYLEKLKAKYPDIIIEKSDTSSTADAAKKIVELDNNDGILKLAVGSAAASEICDVFILDSTINDRVGNTTRFLVLQRRGSVSEDLSVKNNSNDILDNEQVSLLAFTIKKNEPGSLVDVLMILKDHGLNMASVSSRPYNEKQRETLSKERGRKWDYFFYIEFVCTKEQSEGKGMDWDKFFDALQQRCTSWCLWGTFPRNKRYYQ